ncbi:MAG: hypothetical protein HRU07_09955 [Nitrosopumilus sp.]|nr:hypothetical protein [Nitrosopumilus sp.]NRA06451.1 hypothetical protein [Nitrosopumilus sp.]
MDSIDLLMFRNYSGIDEPAISSPLGYLSIRNIIVFAIFGVIALGLNKLIMPVQFNIQEHFIQFIIVVIPVFIGLIMVMIKPQFGSADSILLSWIYISQNKNKKSKINMRAKDKRKKHSSVLGFVKTLQKKDVTDSDIAKEIFCHDFDELKGIKVTLHSGDGELMADKLVKCYIDGFWKDTTKTSLDGVIIIKIRPEREGKKKLVIKNESDKVIITKTFIFKKR